jgi:ABC-2 type transport system permease protein/sodium transport system permease protein
MSHADSPRSPSAATREPKSGSLRILRLARKELRETLRDRRTIITLVLMPLLVYPVLGFAFRQFLLSSFQKNSQVHLQIGAESQEEVQALMMLVSQGDKLLRKRETAGATAPLTGAPILGADLGAADPPFESLVWGVVDDVQADVRNQFIDLGVRLMKPAEHGDRGNRGEEGDWPPAASLNFQLLFRPNAPISRQAANYVERRLRAVDEDDLRRRLAAVGDKEPLKASWRLRPIADEEGQSFWLGALVPLILILMTITGAVYPAIDLTAGERERGTLEALMAAPVPRLSVLIAKYIAVVTVAMLTAVINLTAMMVTVASTGLGPDLFGTGGLTPQSILAVLILLVLFAAFFSAVLLLITSFARSFKEAQAYLIPLMVAALAPGYMSVTPGLKLGPLLSVTPLANMVLLARDVLEGNVQFGWSAVVVISTILYGGLALALAARTFGSDAILYGSAGSWGDLVRRPKGLLPQATIAGALTALALIMPLFIVVSGLLTLLHGTSLPSQLMAGAGISLFLFAILPMVLARLQGVSIQQGFQLRAAGPLAFFAAAILGCTLWPLAYDLIIVCRDMGIATIKESQPEVEAMVARFRMLPPAAVIMALAVVPAISEELFFRGYLLGALRGRLSAVGAIGLSAAIFGLFHASFSGVIVLERIASSTFLGLALGWICWTTRSVLPGMIVHALNNGLMLSLVFASDWFKQQGWDIEGQRYLPPTLVVATTLLAGGAIFLLAFLRRGEAPPPGQPVLSGEAPGSL